MPVCVPFILLGRLEPTVVTIPVYMSIDVRLGISVKQHLGGLRTWAQLQVLCDEQHSALTLTNVKSNTGIIP